MKYLKFSTLVIFLLFACESNQQKSADGQSSSLPSQFSNVLDLRSDLDSVPISPALLKIRYMIATDDYLLVMLPKKDTIFKVFDAETVSYLGSFGFEGQGPLDLEFNGANASSLKPFGNGFIVADQKRMRVFEIKGGEGDVENKFSVKLISSHPLVDDLRFMNNGFMVDEKGAFSTQMFSKSHFVYWDFETGALSDSIAFPNLYPEIPEGAKYHLYWSNVGINQNRIAIAYQRFPMIKIADLKTGRSSEILYSAEHEQTVVPRADDRGRSIANSIEMIGYHRQVVTSDNHIYALYQEESHSVNGSTIESHPLTEKEIHIYDWSGKPVKKLLLPSWVNWFTVTPDDGFIYFFHPEKENFLFRKSLSDLKN